MSKRVTVKTKDVDLPKVARSQMNEEKMEALVDSLKSIGLIHPIIVRRKGDKYEVVAGTRRLLASQFAGQNEITADLRDVSDREALEIMLRENIQREDLNAVDKGRLCKELLDRDFYPSIKAISAILGLRDSQVGQWIKLAQDSTTKEIQELVAAADESFEIPKGKITYKVAYHIITKIKDVNRQKGLAKLISKKGLSSAAIKYIVKLMSEEGMSVKQAYEKMTELPPLLPFRANFKEPILRGIKTQTARTGLPKGIVKGAIVDSHFTDPRPFKLKIIDIYRKKLGEFDEDDAKREGGYTLEEFKKVWEATVDKEWNPDQAVYIVRFEVFK